MTGSKLNIPLTLGDISDSAPFISRLRAIHQQNSGRGKNAASAIMSGEVFAPDKNFYWEDLHNLIIETRSRALQHIMVILDQHSAVVEQNFSLVANPHLYSASIRGIERSLEIYIDQLKKLEESIAGRAGVVDIATDFQNYLAPSIQVTNVSAQWDELVVPMLKTCTLEVNAVAYELDKRLQQATASI